MRTATPTKGKVYSDTDPDNELATFLEFVERRGKFNMFIFHSGQELYAENKQGLISLPYQFEVYMTDKEV